jgi:putative NADPH-quinone reductase
MKVLVVFAHPRTDSLAHAAARTAVDTLAARGDEVRFTDLYAIGFDPRMTAEERAAYNSGTPLVSADVKPLLDDLFWAEALVLCFPHWWYFLPAILKGWFDRVWLPTYTFDVDLGTGVIRPKMRHIRKLGVITSFGAPWWFITFVLRNPTRTILRRGYGRLFAPGFRLLWVAHYSMNTSTPATRARFLARVARRFARF